jgi:rod shape-determining protein MreC
VSDKTVRRRRAVLLLLVVLSLILLTAYFGEASNGRLHSVQRAFLTVVSPIQDGANKALKPVRDLFGWFGETADAKSQRDQLRKQVDALRRQLAAVQAEQRRSKQVGGITQLDSSLSIADYHPVTATVVGKSPNLWYETVDIGAGEDAGVRLNDPVINGEGLIGKVSEVASDGAEVSLITDSTVGVSARVGSSNSTGIIQPKVGDPSDLLLQYLPASAQPSVGEEVVTSGTVDPPDDSLYPPGLPIGQVTKVGEESAYKTVDVQPYANLHNLDVVQVLTSVQGGLPERLSHLVSTFVPGQNAVTGTGPQLASTGLG